VAICVLSPSSATVKVNSVVQNSPPRAAAAYRNFAAVVAGSTAGMVLACAPVIFIGKLLALRLPLRAIRITASLLFLGLGVLFLVRAALGVP
jgi:putative Ca2+/H+ antiporter (TMEM165/GDT1 family)